MDKDLSSEDARAQRVRAIRDALGLSRPQFVKQFSDVPLGTLQNWEDKRFGGLTEKGARRLVKALQSNGIGCTVEYLLYGIGPEPEILKSANAQPWQKWRTLQMAPMQIFQEDDIIAQELSLFHKLNPNAVDTIITDECMLPQFKIGDRVAGRRVFEKDIDDVIGQVCIVHFHDNPNALVRNVEAGSKVGFYNLMCSNPAACTQPVLENVKLLSAAPILWLRRKGEIHNK